MHWLALYLPCLPLDAVADAAVPAFHHQAGQQHPLGVIEGGRLIAISGGLSAACAHIGMTLAAASSLMPGLHGVERQPDREAALLQRLAMALSGYTPTIVVEPDGLRLELSSTLRLFGGPAGLLNKLEATARACGVGQTHLAHAATPAAASVLARVEDPSLARAHPSTQAVSPAERLLALTRQRLDQLPIAAVLPLWTQPRPMLELLQGIGCRLLRDLRALPRAGLTRRGGRELMSQVARAYGDEPDPQVIFEPPPTFELGFELMHRADDAAALVFAAQRLVHPLAGWLATRWLAASRLSLRLRHDTTRRDELPDSTLVIALAQPSRDAAQIMLLLRERLQRMTLPAPVYAIVLRLDDAVSYEGRSGALWSSPTSQRESERALIDRLTARLGSESVQRVKLCADHRPERAMRWVSAQSEHRAGEPRRDREAGPRKDGGERSGATGDKGCGDKEGDRARGFEHGADKRSGGNKGSKGANQKGGKERSKGADERVDKRAAEKRDDETGDEARDRDPAIQPDDASDQCASASLPLRPTWLLAKPLPLREDGARPIHEGKPLVIVTSAERIEAGWFDDAFVSRDYHVAAGDHACYWIYRERGVGASARWFLHGIFG